MTTGATELAERLARVRSRIAAAESGAGTTAAQISPPPQSKYNSASSAQRIDSATRGPSDGWTEIFQTWRESAPPPRTSPAGAGEGAGQK